MFIALFIGILLICCAFFVAGLYNSLINLRSQLERAWSNIDVILKQRYDEIPQLIQVIEQYSQYEAGILQNLADARSKYGQAVSVPEKIGASQEVSSALRGIFALGENYPELKANQNFMQLQSRISGLEEAIADRRETYNDSVANFNTRIDQFPDVFVARFLEYHRQEMFKASESERTAPNLKMNLPKFGKGA